MALYLIGDVQGCDEPLQRLLDHIDFSPSRDRLVLLGDLVNRGPASLDVLRRIQRYEGAASALLGNHDLHLLGVAKGARKAARKDTIEGILAAPDRDALLEWLRHQHLALHLERSGRDLLMVHAGVLPQWSLAETLTLAGEVESVLRGASWGDFLQTMYGNEPARWDDSLFGSGRLRVIVNALTRLRYCDARGTMEFDTKDASSTPPPGFMPWFDVPGRRTGNVTVAFGHWSTLGWVSRTDLISTDTGCVWGGCLSAVRIGATLAQRELIQVRCPKAQKPD